VAASNIDPGFTAFPFENLSDAALTKAKELGCSYADFRFERHKSQTITARDRTLETITNADVVGYGVRVIHRGAWGFASDMNVSGDAASATAARAVEAASAFAVLNSEPVELAEEPAYQDVYVSSYETDPFAVPDQQKIAFLLGLNDRVLASGKAQRANSYIVQVLENKYFASLDGSSITQQRVRVTGDITAVRIDPATGAFETMSAVPPPAGRGWEHFTKVHDYTRDADEIPELLEEKMKSKSVEPGRYDLVIHPSNLWLTIHESIGHSTELDRVLGYEANFAGTSFATLDKLNTLHIGSPEMNITGDREVEHGLSTVGYDDEGVKAQRWDIIRDGLLVGYQLNRQMAQKLGFGRSNGCAFADAPSHLPLQRMPNVSLQPSPKDISLDDLLGGVERGIYIVGNKSWSIDQQRYNFQFTGQRLFEVRGGKVVGQLKDVAYQGSTVDFWNSMEAVGGSSTYVLGGTFSCGKGQPGQVAPVSHGCPAALFRQVNVLNTAKEGSG
jgi:TldD protein